MLIISSSIIGSIIMAIMFIMIIVIMIISPFAAPLFRSRSSCGRGLRDSTSCTTSRWSENSRDHPSDLSDSETTVSLFADNLRFVNSNSVGYTSCMDKPMAKSIIGCILYACVYVHASCIKVQYRKKRVREAKRIGLQMHSVQQSHVAIS